MRQNKVLSLFKYCFPPCNLVWLYCLVSDLSPHITNLNPQFGHAITLKEKKVPPRVLELQEAVLWCLAHEYPHSFFTFFRFYTFSILPLLQPWSLSLFLSFGSTAGASVWWVCYSWRGLGSLFLDPKRKSHLFPLVYYTHAKTETFRAPVSDVQHRCTHTVHK